MRLPDGCAVVLALVATLGLAVLVLVNWPPLYSAAPIHGRVVDAQTGHAIGDAVIVVRWETVAFIEGSNVFAYREVTAAADGTFLVPGWGPRFHRPFSRLLDSTPVICVFAPGYWRSCLENKSGFDGMTVALQTVRDPAGEAKNLNDSANAFVGQHMHLPRFAAAWARAVRRLPPAYRRVVEQSHGNRLQWLEDDLR